MVEGKKNVGYVYAVAKEGTGFSGNQTIVTADGTIIKGVVAYKAFSIDSDRFVAKNVSHKNGTYAAGLPVKPEVTIQIGGSTLVEGKDYKLTLIDKNDDTITPTGIYPFTTETTPSFTVTLQSLMFFLSTPHFKACSALVP